MMKRTITAIATAALVSMAAFSGAAFAAQDEMTMVHDTVVRTLSELGLPTDGVDNLTMAQVQQIISLADGNDRGDAVKVQVQTILSE